ncbi:MAG TPA: guanylate kinase [Dehalococcoidia bacterium]|nr:MAG: guanylate kinase [SAR202 cluster bacterium]HIM78759.1 guanylate kinase [Dehalococcoidia bacterium]
MPQILEASSAPPLLVVLSGPSGVGKDAALDALKLLDRPWHFVVTATTRTQRQGEQDGVDYIFLETGAFLKMKERDELLECAQVYGNWYGVPRNQVRQGLRNGKDVFLKVDVQGADTVRELAPEALFIFMIPSSLDDLRSRLTLRMTEKPSEMELRISIAESELGRVGEYDYRVVNREGQLEQAVAEIDAIITAEKCRTRPRVVDFL